MGDEASQTAPEPHWPSIERVRRIHKNVMDATGDVPRHDNEARLAGALSRPQQQYHYGGVTDLRELAVWLGVAVSQAQAFEEGNKRTGYACMADFLDRHGFRVTGPWLEVAHWLERIAEAPRADREALTVEFGDWLRQHSAPIEP